MMNSSSRIYPEFSLARLLKTVFEPKPGQRIGILIDLANPKQIEGFAFLKDAALTTCPKEVCPAKRWAKGQVARGIGGDPPAPDRGRPGTNPECCCSKPAAAYPTRRFHEDTDSADLA